MSKTTFECGSKISGTAVLVHYLSIENEELPDGRCYIAFSPYEDDTPLKVATCLVAAANELLAHIERIENKKL